MRRAGGPDEGLPVALDVLGRGLVTSLGWTALSPHFHALLPGGVFVERAGAVDFVAVPAPTPAEVARMVTRLAGRVAKALHKRRLEDEDVAPEDGLARLAAQGVKAIED